MAVASTLTPEQAKARRARRESRRRILRHMALLAWTGIHRLPDLLDGDDVFQGLGRVGHLAAELDPA